MLKMKRQGPIMAISIRTKVKPKKYKKKKEDWSEHGVLQNAPPAT